MLAGYAPEPVLAETTSRPDFEAALRDGLLWVAVANDGPVGFAHAKLLEPECVHLDELDVHTEHGRRGIGRRLVAAVCDWGAAHGKRFATLSTFTAPPWNAPLYESLGFEVVPEASWSPAMRRIVVDETRRGLDPARRVIMRRPL
jgi:GNAT superfamily N-acetyltransferase